ncbi:YolD-like family protein [Staphylococcus sp. NRL 16/872]|uniref:YolD-like family protein n=1 Tax=Staphylococcus sp. NRL 16/872 TaxID=2930131 RepID=UPI001FB1F8D3|nr:MULTISPECIES: YolD-like family protein [unclassified Staphylococcus]MCJ1655419.1 YolD-like family protein [Staphylococcus sp. NRL 21/187]MCJ1667144.1 YolD-like family protein [Staphylococcus sp. NRL 19/737]WEN70542.1 YolD-like family protein [Staphylococcus sp. NRL 16/872]
MMPEEYKHETDYRKIPREYLDPNIPQGRGMVKWAPFATMPEQYERLREFIEEQNKITMPSLSEDQFDTLNRQLTQKYTQHQLAMISYWRNGYIHSIAAYIRRIDMLNQCITISNENGSQTMKLEFAIICNVE